MADPGKVAATVALVDAGRGDAKVGATAILVDAGRSNAKVGSVAVLVDAYIGEEVKGYFRLGKNLIATGITT